MVVNSDLGLWVRKWPELRPTSGEDGGYAKRRDSRWINNFVVFLLLFGDEIGPGPGSGGILDRRARCRISSTVSNWTR